nr:endolytic transglycosylase MltG [uncultured Anaerocolumna sp.]
MKRKRLVFMVILLVFTNVTLLFLPYIEAEAASKKYGLIIANEKGKYTFYDLNEAEGKAGLETVGNGNVMVPLWRMTKLMPGLTYKYDSKTKEATVTNKSNGKKIVFKKDSTYFNYYSSKSSKPEKKKMVYKMYLSQKSSSVMVHMSALRWVMNSAKGCKYYKIEDMKKGGYDTSIYSGLLVYNPYQEVTGLAKATEVNNISKTVRVTIPEGYAVSQVFELLVSKGVCASTKPLYDALYNYDFSYYPLVKAIPENEFRCFLLEGYLYPDTYEFYRLSKGQDVIGKFLRNGESKITEDMRLKAESLGYTMDEILTIASLIEKEAGNSKTMADISSVIHNRLSKRMKLELDASIYYVERYIKPNIDGDINRYNSYYNTYKTGALPSGPICNPGIKAINAALNPAQTEYLYFYSDENGEYHFSKEYVNPKANASNENVTK